MKVVIAEKVVADMMKRLSRPFCEQIEEEG